MNFRLLLLLLLSAGAPGLGRAAEGASAVTNQLSLDAVVAEALVKNPQVRAARAAARAADARVPQARAWDDPRAGLDVERFGTTDFFDWTDNEWMLSQAIPLNGKNRQRARAASADASAVWADVRWRELDLSVRVRAAYARLANAHAQLAISREVEALYRRHIELIRARYASGDGSPAGALMVEGDLVKLLEARRDIERRVSDGESQLNVLMNRPAAAPLAPPRTNQFVEVRLEQGELQRAALETRPDLQAGDFRTRAAAARVDLAKRAWIPDPEIRVEARQVNGRGGFIHEYDTGIFFNIPWLNRGKYRAAITEAERMREAQELQLEAAQAQALGAVRDQLKKIETFHHHYTLFGTRLVPLARQAAEALRVDYVNGKAQSLEVINALRTVHEVSAMHQDHLADYLVAIAELEAVIGRPLGELRVPAASTPEQP
jgi:cobalt-zinc-cadmium efflux system outer membrane protein